MEAPFGAKVPKKGRKVNDMKRLKKALALALALTVVMAFSGLSVFAADAASVNAGKAKVTFTGVASGNNVKLYKVASATVKADNTIEYTMTTGLPEAYDTIKEIEAIKSNSTEANAMANAYGAFFGGKTADFTSPSGAEVGVDPGYYFAIVSGDNDTSVVYKSMLINAVPQVDGNEYKIHEDQEIAVKKENVTVEKTELDPATNAQAKTTDGYKLGDQIPFTITTAIPQYPSNATQAKFIIKDTPTGLEDQLSTVEVKVNGVKVNAAEGTFAVAQDGNGFTVTFAEAYITAHPGESVVVTYKGKLVGPVTLSGGTENTASIEYNPNPFEDKSVEPNDTDTQTTYGLVFEKVNEKDEALENAVFALYDSEGNAVKDKDGNDMTFTTRKQTISGADHTYVWFEGLAAGTYTIKETTAPAGYVTVADFTMTVGKEVSKSDNPATTDKAETNYTVKKDGTVKNEKGTELPSTGGMGTTIFYIVGVILVVGAGILLISRRRMQAK